VKLIDQDEMTMEEVKAVVDEAHAHKLPVVAHAHRPDEIRRGLAAGVDCFEHTGLATSPEYPADIRTAIAERTAKMNKGPLFWCPTIEGFLKSPEVGRRSDQTAHVCEPSILQGIQQLRADKARAPGYEDPVIQVYDKIRSIWRDSHDCSVTYFSRTGLRFAKASSFPA
jgi:hypothetical protein